jgi:hypothetical protein
MDGSSFWWDASDATTVTKDGSNLVSQLADKSGNANHLTQATDAKKPQATVTINGVAALDCRTDRYMTPASAAYIYGPCEVFFVVWSDRAATADNTYVLFNASSSTLNRGVMAAKTQFGGTALSGSAVTRGNGTMRHTLIQHSYTDGADGAITQYMAIDGRLRSGSVTTSGVGGSTGAFSSATGTVPMNGLFGEMLVFNKTLSTTERENVLTYLADKWRALDTVTKYHIVLIAGQSNARGTYGPVNLTTDATDPRIAMLERTYNASTGVVVEDDAGEIVLAEHPLSNRWRDAASPPAEDSVGMGMAYAKSLLATLPADEGVLLVPCAQGSTYIMDSPPLSPDVTWSPTPGGSFSNAPFTDAVARVNRMIALGHELHSIIWHQGESEAARPTMAQATYAAYLDAVVDGFRTQITGATNTPFIAGELGTFLSGVTYPNAANVNAAIADLPARRTNTAYASSASLTDGGDSLHFDAASARTLGGRYWTAFLTI